jgi:hypothetical protein
MIAAAAAGCKLMLGGLILLKAALGQDRFQEPIETDHAVGNLDAVRTV